MNRFFAEFRKFIARGNVMDLAVGIVVGTAFSAVTNSLVENIISPPLGLLIGEVDFSNLGIILKNADQYASVKEAIAADAPVLQYGAFINTIINFLIVSFAMFLLIRLVNYLQDLREREEADPASPAEPPREVRLLEEIRDLLAQGAANGGAGGGTNAR